MSIITPENTPEALPADIESMARELFAALPSGGVNPAFLPAPQVPAVAPTPSADIVPSAEALPHYLTSPTFDTPVKPYSPALGGFGRPLAPPPEADPRNPPGFSPAGAAPLQSVAPVVPALGLDIPCESGLKPQGDTTPPLRLGTGLAPQGSLYQTDEALYFLNPSQNRPVARPSASGFDAQRYRRDFPILSEIVHGKRLVWLDNGATTQKPQAVIDRLSHFYAHENSNIHRAAHELAARATDAYEGARETVSRFLNAPSAETIVFTRGTTEAINLVAETWGRANLGPGDEVLISHLEHHANIVPWVRLREALGFTLKVIPVDDHGDIRLEDYARLLTGNVKFVAFTQVSNALGTVTPAKLMIEMAHAAGAVVLLDGAQSVSHMPVDVQALNPDFFVFSGHKVFGPTGIGALYGRRKVLEAMPPWQGGGNMIEDVTFERIRYHGAPMKFEAGTGNIADAAGLATALDYVLGIGREAIEAHEHSLIEHALHLLRGIKGVRIVGEPRERAGVVSFVMDKHSVPVIGKALSAEGIAVRAGHHCAQPILRRMGHEATVRPSFALYNSFEDIEALAAVLRRLG